MSDGLPFEVCGGMVAGYDHTLPGKPGGRNNQDAFSIWRRDGVLVGCVFDGCGSGRRSEFGAVLGSRIVPRHIAEAVRQHAQAPAGEILEAASGAILHDLETQAWLLSDEDGPAQAIEDHLLFTVLGFALTDQRALVFGAGDGLWAINGEIRAIDQHNRPSYLGYGVLGHSARLELHADLPCSSIETLLVATDGAAALDARADEMIPMVGGLVGPLAQFWRDDIFYRNADAVRRRLALINQDRAWWDAAARRLIRHPGFLNDDTTLVALRRQGGA